MLKLAYKPKAHTYYCVCLVNLFNSVLVNTTLFLLRYYKVPILLEIYYTMLLKSLVKGFNLKVKELTIPNLTYYTNIDCSKFISLQYIKANIRTYLYYNNKTYI